MPARSLGYAACGSGLNASEKLRLRGVWQWPERQRVKLRLCGVWQWPARPRLCAALVRMVASAPQLGGAQPLSIGRQAHVHQATGPEANRRLCSSPASYRSAGCARVCDPVQDVYISELGQFGKWQDSSDVYAPGSPELIRGSRGRARRAVSCLYRLVQRPCGVNVIKKLLRRSLWRSERSFVWSSAQGMESIA